MIKPTVAIIGRPNVGKSTLFNKLVGERIAIVEDTPGVTRDRIIADVEWLNHHFTLIDTGGIEPFSDDDILKQMRIQAEVAIEMADLVLLLTDGKEGITAADQEVISMLRKHHKTVLLVVNKLDTKKQEEAVYEFYNLGIGDPIPISAEQGLGIGDLLDRVLENIQKFYNEEEEEDQSIRVAVIGKPNTGKSTLINKMIGEDRLIVSDVAGTTRDAVDTNITVEGQDYTFIDTAGLRKKKKILDDIEHYSIIRAIAAIERANVCLFMIDGQEGITEQDKKIAGIAHNRSIPSIIVMNKWDALEKDDKTMKKMEGKIRNELEFLKYAPILFISAKTGQRTHLIYKTIQFVLDQSAKRITTGKLNEALADWAMVKQPPSKNGRRLKLLYLSQPAINPPTFVLFVNDTKLLHFSYKRYLENKIRETFDFDGTPVKFFIRERND